MRDDARCTQRVLALAREQTPAMRQAGPRLVLVFTQFHVWDNLAHLIDDGVVIYAGSEGGKLCCLINDAVQITIKRLSEEDSSPRRRHEELIFQW